MHQEEGSSSGHSSTVHQLCHQHHTIITMAPCPETHAGFWSKIFFTWVSPLIAQAKKKPLELPDLPDLDPQDLARGALQRLHTAERELRGQDDGAQPTLTQLLYKSYARDFGMAGIVKLGHDWYNTLSIIRNTRFATTYGNFACTHNSYDIYADIACSILK